MKAIWRVGRCCGILLAVLLVLLGSSLVSGVGGTKDVDTWQAVDYIEQNQAKQKPLW